MILSMADNRSNQPEDDSILGLGVQMSNSEENNDDFETFEMSQIFSDELGEEIWASQNISP
ncbi:hypothetical protein X975_10412, partial [Stegodyphus mimosarum]